MDRYEGFADFVLARGPALARTAFLLTGDRHTAEDLVQTALVNTATHWRRVVAVGNPEAYVRRVMVNQRTSWWRRQRETAGTIPEASAADESDRTADRVMLAQALAALPIRQRAVVVLRFYEDYSVAETAEAMGCAEGTIKSQTHEALRRLRSLLATVTLPDISAADIQRSADTALTIVDLASRAGSTS